LASRRQIIFYDQRGCGESGDASDYSWERHVEDLARLIQEVSPEEPVFLAGSSWGAMLAWYYTERHPSSVERLVLSGLPAPDVWTLPGGETRNGPPVDIDRAKTFEERERAGRALAGRMVGSCEDVRSGTIASYGNAPSPWRLYDLTNPVLFFPDNRFGRAFGDAVEDPEIVASFTFVVGGGHDPWFFWPDEFFGIVEAFLGEPL
jgi:pimeloyl-ACP methyl ester carboxylesterase